MINWAHSLLLRALPSSSSVASGANTTTSPTTPTLTPMAPRKRAAAKQDPATDTVAAPVNGTTTNATIPDAAPYGAVARPLQSIRVVISGHVNVSDYTPHGIEYLLGDLGAAQDQRVINAVTHVIATREDFLKNATKVRNGLDKGLPILRATWVTECDRTQTFVDIEKHTWPSVIEEEKKLKEARDEYIAAQNAAGQTNGADKKRPIAVANTNGTDANGADAVEEEDEQPKAKKPKATRAKKAAPKPEPVPEPEDEDEEMKDADEEPANQEQNGGEKEAKVAEGQIIKQKGAVIPVDAVCQLPGFQVFVDPDSGIIYDASLNQTNASNNNNKFYIVQVCQMVNEIVKTPINRSSCYMSPSQTSSRHGLAGAALVRSVRTPLWAMVRLKAL